MPISHAAPEDNYVDIKQDSLKQDWSRERAWCNPGYEIKSLISRDVNPSDNTALEETELYPTRIERMSP